MTFDFQNSLGSASFFLEIDYGGQNYIENGITLFFVDISSNVVFPLLLFEYGFYDLSPHLIYI